MVRYKSQKIASRFDIDEKTFTSVINLCHSYLTYAIGPALVHRGPPLSSLSWSQMFVYAIREFETTHILLNDKIMLNSKCSPVVDRRCRRRRIRERIDQCF